MILFRKGGFLIFASLLALTLGQKNYKDLRIWKVLYSDIKEFTVTHKHQKNIFSFKAVVITEIENSNKQYFLYYWVGTISDQPTRLSGAKLLAQKIKEKQFENVTVERIAGGKENCSQYFCEAFNLNYDPFYDYVALYKVKGQHIVKIPATFKEIDPSYSLILNTKGDIIIWVRPIADDQEKNAVDIFYKYERRKNSLKKAVGDTILFVTLKTYLGGEYNSPVKKENKNEYNQLEEERYSEKYREATKYCNNSIKNVTNTLLRVQQLESKCCYLLIDKLGREKFVFIGKDAKHTYIENAVTAAEMLTTGEILGKEFKITYVQEGKFYPPDFLILFTNGIQTMFLKISGIGTSKKSV